MGKFRPLRPDELAEAEKHIKLAKEQLASAQKYLAFWEDLTANGWWDGDLKWPKES